MKRIVCLILIVTTVLSLLLNSHSVLTGLVIIIATLGNIYIINKYKVRDNLTMYIVLTTFWLSVVFIPSYRLVYHLLGHFVGVEEIRDIDYEHLLFFGARVYFVSIITWFALSGLQRPRIKMYVSYKAKPISERYLALLFVFLFILTAFCYAIGLGRMGEEPITLPFHLGGFINLFRSAMVPLLFAVIVENFILRGIKFPTKYYLLFAFWVIFETFAWMSKSIVISYFEPLAIMLFLYYRPSIKKILRVAAPFLLAFLFLYPIIGYLREMDSSQGLSKNFSEAREMSADAGFGAESVLKPLNRTFLTAHQYVQDHDYIEEEALFDFSRLLAIIASGGAAGYQTRIMDGYPETAYHSSGTSGLMDPLLHGGYGLCYLMIILIMSFARLNDKNLFKERYGAFAVICLFIWTLANSRNISLVYDGDGIQTTIVYLIVIIMANRLNYRPIIK